MSIRRSTLQKWIDTCSQNPLLVVGDLMLDHWVWGQVSRISPEAPIPVVDVVRYTYTPGGAANVVSNLRTLGVPVRMVGVVGRDESGRRLKTLLKREGADVSGVVADPTRPTTLKTRIVAHSQQVVRADFESRESLSPALQVQVLEVFQRHLEDCRGVVFSDYNKGLFQPGLVGSMIALAQQKGVPLLGGPKPENLDRFLGATLITLNAREAHQASGVATTPLANLLEAGSRLASRLPGSHLVVTRGEQGMTLFEQGGKVHHQPALASQVFDVSGAGDTVLATLAWSLAAGAVPAQAIEVASHAAAVVVKKVGTATASAQEILESFQEPR